MQLNLILEIRIPFLNYHYHLKEVSITYFIISIHFLCTFWDHFPFLIHRNLYKLSLFSSILYQLMVYQNFQILWVVFFEKNKILVLFRAFSTFYFKA